MTDYPALIREARAHWMTIGTIEAKYGLPRRRIRAYMAAGLIESFWIDGQYRISPASLDAYLSTLHRQAVNVE
jgi:predicted DNA-binding ArsR family transcriptional regulator